MDVLGPHFTKESVSPPAQSLIQDSEWFALGPQEKLAWVKASRDPRIAEGQQSPLEKKILNLGGVHTKAARQLRTQKNQEEYQTLYREQGLSLDYWLARVESYYSKGLVGTMKEQEIGDGIEKKWEGKTTQSTERQKQWCLVPEREMRHIERQVRQAAQARELTEKTFRQLLRSPSETALPKIVFEGPGVQNAQRRKQGSSGHALRAQLARARPSYETLTCGNLLGAGSALPGVNEEKSLLSVPARGIGLRAEGEVVRLRWRCAEQLHRRGPSRVWESSFSAF
ncbi:uncharacterized protein C10orf120 isoform X3 [Eptesicus fuscus]|uniref:uncharacterized protein C10orf120 isoform X3 n=1 Tax=Eptesicus fuscus TaxID=29078 RepID=UPI0024047E50|nr:uncharacterized protein C10orf120 isoform X3 [Eptesicus fuscus]